MPDTTPPIAVLPLDPSPEAETAPQAPAPTPVEIQPNPLIECRTSCKQQGAPVPQRWIAAGATVTRFDWKVTVLLVKHLALTRPFGREVAEAGHRFAPNLTTFTGCLPECA
jgi:hypothetical protein